MTQLWTVGQQLPNGATVVSDDYVAHADGSSAETMTDSLGDVTVVGTAAPGSAAANAATIQANVQANMTIISTWLAANPNGAVLTAAQTRVLAKMLYGIGLILLGEFSTTTGT